MLKIQIEYKFFFFFFFLQRGILLDAKTTFVIEPLPLEEHFRAKREIEAQSDDDFLVVIYETAASGARRCGLQSQVLIMKLIVNYDFLDHAPLVDLCGLRAA